MFVREKRQGDTPTIFETLPEKYQKTKNRWKTRQGLFRSDLANE